MRRLIILMFLGALLLVSACSNLRQIMPNANTAADRKEKSEKLLKSLGIPVNPHLPLVESESQTKFRSPQETARRTIMLYALVLTAHRVVPDGAAWLKQEELWDSVSPKEKAFFENPEPTEKDRNNATWRSEALFVLLWALGKIDKLDIPTHICDADVVQDALPKPGSSVREFVERAKLRSSTEIIDATDLIYRIDWAVTEAHLNKQAMPAGLNGDVVYERHYALNWLTYYSDNWDDVTTDT